MAKHFDDERDEPATIGRSAVPKTSRKALRTELHECNLEYRELGPEAALGNAAALTRRSEIARRLRVVSAALTEREPDVIVQVPRSSTGHPFRIGPHEFWAGEHTMKKSVAQYLLWLVDQDRTNEVNRMKQNGREFDLGTIGQKAKMGSLQDDL